MSGDVVDTTEPGNQPLITWTVFPNKFAEEAHTQTGTLYDLAQHLANVGPYTSKDKCPLIKLATFGLRRTQEKSLRSNENVLTITGIEGDYDAEVVTPQEAVERLERYGIRAIVYTSASHGVVGPKSNGGPRWRILAPLSRAYPPSAKAALTARLNGALGGILAGESFTLSQPYYYGEVTGVEYGLYVTFDDPEEGTCIDELDELDEIAVMKRERHQIIGEPGTVKYSLDIFENTVKEKGRLLKTGDGRHRMLVEYVASRSARGMLRDELVVMVEGVINKYFDPKDPPDQKEVMAIIDHYVRVDGKAGKNSQPADIGNFLDKIMPMREVAVAEPEPESRRVVLALPGGTVGGVRVCEQASSVDTPIYPAHLLQPGGIAQDIMDWMLTTAQRPQPVLALVGALCVIGTALGNKIASPSNLRTNYYFLSVAGTATGKDHARKCIKTLLRAATKSHWLGGEELASGQALLSRVAAYPVSLFQIDEFGLMLQAVKSKGAAAHVGMIPTNLMKLFTSAGDVYHGTEYADQKIRPRVDVQFPCALLHGTTTADTLWPCLQGKDMLSGYLNRMLIAFAPDDRPAKQRGVQMVNPPANVVEWIKAAHDMECGGILGLSPDSPFTVFNSPMAQKIFDDFDDWIEVRLDETKANGMDALWGRASEHVAKLAIGLACARHSAEELKQAAASNNLEVDPTSMQYAVDLVRFMLTTMEQQILIHMGDSEFDRQVLDVAKAISKAGPRGRTVAELSTYSRTFRSLKPQEQDAVLSALARRELAARVAFDPPKGGGKKREAIVSTEYLTETILDVTQTAVLDRP